MRARKENARHSLPAGRANVREHMKSIAQSLEGEPLPMTKREERILGAIFTGFAFLIVILDVIVRNL